MKGWGLEGPARGPWLRRGEESPMGGTGQQPGAQVGVNVWGRVWPGPLSTHFAETTKALDIQETMNSCSQAPASHRLIMEGWLVRSLPFKLTAIDFSFHSFPHQPSLRPAPGSEQQGCGQRLETLPSRRFAGPLRQGAGSHALGSQPGAGTLLGEAPSPVSPRAPRSERV